MSDLNISHINIRSLRAHFDNFVDYVIEADHDVIAVSESWLSHEIADDVVNVPGYKIVRCDRLTHGGGVALYIRDSFNFQISNHSVIHPYIEQLWVTLTIADVSLAVGVVYRPPGSNLQMFFDFIEECIPNIMLEVDSLVCLGDINIDLLIPSPASVSYRHILDGLGLQQLIVEPTRVSRFSSTLLDHILVSDGTLVNDSGVVDLQNISDHHLVYTALNISPLEAEPDIRCFRSFSSFDMDAFRRDLELVPWHTIYTLSSVEEKVFLMNSFITDLFNVHAPLRTTASNKPSRPWITPVIRRMMALRNRARAKFERLRRDDEHDDLQLQVAWDYYRDLRNRVTFSIRQEKRAFFTFLTEQTRGDTRSLWSELGKLNIQGKSSKIPSELSDPNQLNLHFVSNPQVSGGIPDELYDYYWSNVKDGVNSYFSFSLVSIEEVGRVVASIRSNAVGSDFITIKMISLCCPVILPVVTHIVNTCLLEGVFPSVWGEAHVIPFPKVKNCSEFKDLRPISILSPFAKILEKIIDKQVRGHLSSFNILPENQSGFRPHYDCASVLAAICDDIISSLDSNLNTALVLIDFSKAFDTIDHGLLLSILHFVGFSEDAIGFFYNYLSNRSQRVKISNQLSEALPLSCGVPQGSVLGPLLYNIYTSQLYNCLEFCKYHLYADDSQIYYSFENKNVAHAENVINNDLDKLVTTATNHGLKINPIKSSVLLFCKKRDREFLQRGLSLTLGGNTLPFSSVAKDLGLYLDTDLRFRKHVSGLVCKAYGSLRRIYLYRRFLTSSVRKILCESLVLSHFNFCDVVYGPCLDANTAMRIQRVQNSCLRFIYGIRRRNRISYTLKLAKWLNMDQRRYLHLICFFHKVLIFKTPPYLFTRLSYRTDIHNLNLRHRGLLCIPRYRSTFFRRSFSYLIASSYNKVPNDFKVLRLSSFKYRLKNKLLMI